MNKINTTTALTLALGLAAHTAHATTQDNYDLEYNTFTGEVLVYTDGPIISYAIESSTPVFDPQEHLDFLRTPIFIPGVGEFPLKTGTRASTPTFIGETELTGSNPAGVYSLGTILPAGLSFSEWLGVPDQIANYTPGLGQPAQSFDLTYVPEPTSLAVVSFAGLLLARRRRAIA